MFVDEPWIFSEITQPLSNEFLLKLVRNIVINTGHTKWLKNGCFKFRGILPVDVLSFFSCEVTMSEPEESDAAAPAAVKGDEEIKTCFDFSR